MHDRVRIATATALVALLAAAALPVAAAQGGSGNDWHGQSNQMGTLQMKGNDQIKGEKIPVTAKFSYEDDLREQDATWFVFSFIWQGTPLNAEFVSLKTSSGQNIDVTEKKTPEGKVQWQVDVADMPQEGATIEFTANVGAEDRGLYQFGAMVMAFDYRWNKVRLDNGNPAELYSYTQLGVQETTGGVLDGVSGLLNVPAPGAALTALAAVGVALAARRRPRLGER